jgi:hypothetical protein
VSGSRAAALLAAPFGRQFVFERLGFSLEHDLFGAPGPGQEPGTAVLRAVGTAWRPPRARPGWRDVPAGELRAAVARLVARGDWRRELAGSEAELLVLLARLSQGFGFDGAGEGLWELTSRAADALLPVARALAAAPAASTWWNPLERLDQRHVQWRGKPLLAGDAVARAVWKAAAREREQNADGLAAGPREREPGQRYGAFWWSGPSYSGTWTGPAYPGVPALELLCWFDGPPPEAGNPAEATVWSLEIDPAARVFEVTGPGDWQQLVSEFPRDVTGTHDGEWRDWGGQPGPWRLPDWPAVAGRYDGVHVTIGGALAASGLALPAAGGYTMLAGWMPGATLWLRDVAASFTRAGTWHGDAHGNDSDDLVAGWRPAGYRPASGG